MKSDLEIYVQAEFAAIEHLMVRMLSFQALQMKHMGMAHDAYLQKLLESSTNDLDLVDFWDIPASQKELVREKAKARLADLITAASAR